MDIAEIHAQLTDKFAGRIVAVVSDGPDPWIEVSPSALVDVCRFLRDKPSLRFDMCNCITVVDYLHTDEKKASKVDWEPHLELVYHLSSITHKRSFVLKIKTSRWEDDRAGSLPEVPSVSSVWKTAHWHEREVFDLSGVQFAGHPDLRRILCPEDWQGHPLRKDYEMPTEYHGIRNR